MEYLVFQLYAPLASWGEIAVGGERRSARQPSKSAIIGLVAAALGIRRDQENEQQTLGEALGVGVKMVSSGSVLKDFHTVQAPKKTKKCVLYTRRDELRSASLGTILSTREYRCDAYSIVAIWLKDDSFKLTQIQQCLRTPVFQVYLGRKSCAPALPFHPQVIDASSLKAAFDGVSFDFPTPAVGRQPDWLKSAFSNVPATVLNKKTVTYFFEECENSGFDAFQRISRYDMPLSRTRWQFVSRIEYMVMESGEEAADVHQ